MATYSIDQIKNIILNNPNKALVKKGREISDKLKLHLLGVGLKSAMSREDYFENQDIFNSRTKNIISNKDMFSRLLQQEEMVFTARGGSSNFNLEEEQERQMNATFANVRYNVSLRNWIKLFALPAYRCDPMGILFIEVEPLLDISGDTPEAPKCYPTYKSIHSIFDYEPNGRELEYVCFQLTLNDLIAFGIKDDEVMGDNTENKGGAKTTPYFRFVDDAQDIIVKQVEQTIVIATNMSQQNPIENKWGEVPGFIVSDLIQFDDPLCFASPVGIVTELADSFLYKRSIRDLQEKYHGFAKAIEPLLKCSNCDGSGNIKGEPCAECTPPGQTTGTGYKLKTKVSDVAKFPIEILENGGFDFKKIMGYVTPDIQSWNKQDSSLDALENIIYATYWGVSRDMKSQARAGAIDTDQTQETATKSLINLQPKYARLNATADWAEKTENNIADFMGKFWYDQSWKGSSISYGRNYILETPEDLRLQYTDMRTSGAPDFMLDEALERYYRAAYQNNPIQLAKYLKLLDVEPFPHVNLTDAAKIILNQEDLYAKMYFGEWYSTLQDIYIIDTPIDKLREELKVFSSAKIVAVPIIPEPAMN